MGSYTHADAEVAAATVAGMPESLGGIRMAIGVVELARVGITPDWMPGVVPRCVPLETKRGGSGNPASNTARHALCSLYVLIFQPWTSKRDSPASNGEAINALARQNFRNYSK
jgi:hypothetical protein